MVFVGRRRPAQIFDKPELAPEEKRTGAVDTTARDARLLTITKDMADEQYLSRPATSSTSGKRPGRENDAEIEMI